MSTTLPKELQELVDNGSIELDGDNAFTIPKLAFNDRTAEGARR